MRQQVVPLHQPNVHVFHRNGPVMQRHHNIYMFVPYTPVFVMLQQSQLQVHACCKLEIVMFSIFKLTRTE